MTERARPTVLVFAGHYLPGCKAGGILRSVENSVNHLHNEFEFKIVTRDRDLGDEAPYPGIRLREWQRVGPADVYYLPPGGESVASLRDVVQRTPHDLIRLNSFFDPLTVKVLLNRRLGRIGDTPIVLSPFGEFAWASLRQKYPKKALFMALARLTRLYDPVIWHASSDHEAVDIQQVMKVPPARIRVVSDLPTVFEGEVAARAGEGREHGRLRVVFFSRISPEKNLDLALRILARVKSPTTFDIVGPIENVPYWEKCERLIRELPAHVTARSLGGIRPNDVMPTLSRYDVMLLPTGGEAYGHAIAEALMAGTPVLVSTNTPWRDLASKGLGWDLPLDDLAPFVRVLDELASSSDDGHRERRRRVREVMQRWLADSSALRDNRQLYHGALGHRTGDAVSSGR